MISMSVVHSIHSMRKEVCSIAAIARELYVSAPTVREYLKARDLSPKPPVRRSRPSKIDLWVPLIEQWLARIASHGRSSDTRPRASTSVWSSGARTCLCRL